MFLEHYHRATDRQRTNGATWYRDAGRCAETLAERYGRDVSTVAAIMAVLSQRVTWKYTLQCTVLALQGGTVQHLGHVRDKVSRLLAGEDPETVVSGPKIRAFYRAIRGDTSAVVLDSWMLGLTDRPRPTIRQYERLAEILHYEAWQAGVQPAIFQAIVWCTIRGNAVRNTA